MPIDKFPSTGGLDSNVISITANTGSLINANSVNFNNTSTITVAVGQGATSNIANVSFTAQTRVTSLGIVLALGG